MAEGRLIIEGRANWAYTVWLTDKNFFEIGRTSDKDIQIEDNACSKQHARITLKEGNYVLNDLDSSNGTYVNGEKVKEHQLADGDEVRIGQSLISFFDGSSTENVVPDFSKTIANSKEGSSIFGHIANLDETFSGLNEGSLKQVDKTEPEWKMFESEIENLKKEVEALTQKNAMLQMMSGEGSANKRMEAVLNQIGAEVEAQNGFVMFIDKTSNRWVVRASYGKIEDWKSGTGSVPMSMSIVTEAVNKGETVFTSSADEDVRFDASQSVLMLDIKSSICAPIQDDEGFVAGVVYLDRRQTMQPFTQKNRELAESFSGMLSAFAG